jgi:hypothetical protein
MKNMLLSFLLFFSVFSMVKGQTDSPPENVVITYNENKTLVQTNENGELLINVSPDDILKFKTKGLVRYSDFGATGAGKTDDIDAIAAAHAIANQLGLPRTSLVSITNSGVKRYIRFGLNQNSGSSQTDIFIVDKDDKVDMDAPIIWDFDQITDIMALPIDETKLTITGGCFTTIANRAESKYTYFSRGIAIRRSNVIVNGLEHRISGEGDHGAPYGGFINIGDCSYVTVRNTILTGRKIYQNIGSAGLLVSMGSYDLSINRALNVSFVNCSQTNDINNVRY